MVEHLVKPITNRLARLACEQYHYSKCMSRSKNVCYGVWELGRFIGVVVFGKGANRNMASPFGLQTTEVCELTRVALTIHKNPVSRYVAIAIRLLHRDNPGLRLIVSYADLAQGHEGGIYRALGWVYIGDSQHSNTYLDGNLIHKRVLTLAYGAGSVSALAKHGLTVTREKAPPKLKYVKTLDPSLDPLIATMAKPYPHYITKAQVAQ